MEKFRCKQCERDFSSEESLRQHSHDKHGLGVVPSKHESRQIKKHERETQQEFEKRKMSRSKLIKRSMYVAVPILVIAVAFAFISSQPPAATTNSVNSISSSEIPRGPIHWHPELTIIINGQQQIIPTNLGITPSFHYPVHTHDTTGVLHYENNNPTPENMPLRYFFEQVWRKPFNSTCILNYCNDGSKTVKMTVNGKENFDFENYIPKDKDDIRIEFS